MLNNKTNAEHALRKLGQRLREGFSKKRAVLDQSLKTVRDTVREQWEQEQKIVREVNSKYHILSPDGYPVTREPFRSQKDAEDYIPRYCDQLRFHGHFFMSGNERISLDDLPKYLTVVPEDRVPDRHGFRNFKEPEQNLGRENPGRKSEGPDMEP